MHFFCSYPGLHRALAHLVVSVRLIYKPDLRSALYFLQPGAGGEIFGALGCWEVVPNGHIIGIVDRLKNGEGSNTQGFSLGVKIIILAHRSVVPHKPERRSCIAELPGTRSRTHSLDTTRHLRHRRQVIGRPSLDRSAPAPAKFLRRATRPQS